MLEQHGLTLALVCAAIAILYGITAAARKYLEPLIRGEAYPPYDRDGLPTYVTLKNVAVKKKLAKWEG